jgi:hypothetical protein
MDTSIDKPIKRPVPKPITGQFPKRGANGQFLPGTVGNPQGRPRGSRNHGRTPTACEEIKYAS